MQKGFKISIVMTFFCFLTFAGDVQSGPAKKSKLKKKTKVSFKWNKNLPSTDLLSPVAGKNYRRSIIHLHNVSSHDACDKDPRPGGVVKEECLNILRKALCDNHVDFAFLTEHRNHMAKLDFNDVVPVRSGDQVNRINGNISEIISPCDNGHKVRFFPGSENNMMNLGQTRHPDLLPGKDLVETYNTENEEAVKLFKATGALSGTVHTENPSHTVSNMMKMDIDYMEIYNLHANLGPDINDAKKKNAGWFVKTILNILAFMTKKDVERDLYFLSFARKNTKALDKWSEISTKMQVTGVAGSDVHRAITKLKLSDGERLDDYRRVTRWFSNMILLPNDPSREEVLNAIKKGKLISVFEIFGTPKDFEFSAESLLGRHEMGDVIFPTWPLSIDPVELRVKIPQPLNEPDAGKPALHEAVLYRATEKNGWIEVARSSGTHLTYHSFEKGVYRAEIQVVPRNLEGFLKGKRKFSKKKYVWVHSNPIYIR